MEMKTKKIKSAIPVYAAAAVWPLLGLICPRLLLKLWFLPIAAVISAAVYAGASMIFKGRTVEVREDARSGDKDVDALINDGRRLLDSLSASNAAIENADISAKLQRMTAAGEEIFNLLERDTKQLVGVRKFMNYYLPTADKLMQSYRLMLESKTQGENMEQAMRSIENSLGMIANAFEKQLDNLHKDRVLDIETDIDVLETMMASDGLIRGEAMKQ